MATTKTERRTQAWDLTRRLDALALPLVGEYGVERAYGMAAEELDLPQVEKQADDVHNPPAR